MMKRQISSILLCLCLLTAPSLASVCPEKCVCNTRDGLHRATCSSLADLYKFTLRQKHHNINVLDLSHNNITKLSHELDRLTEVVTLDLSTNGITELNKFLNNAKKLVHLNLANNRIEKLSLIQVPASVSSLDLTNNLLRDVPSDSERLTSLEHLELEGNPLDCSCENIRTRDRLLAANVYIDKVKCLTPSHLKGKSWLQLKVKDVCKIRSTEQNWLDYMMGDQPIDAEAVGDETAALKSESEESISTLEEGKVIKGENSIDNDDNRQFLKVDDDSLRKKEQIEGSGDTDSSTIYDYMLPVTEPAFVDKIMATDEVIPVETHSTTNEPEEGSGEGSGFGVFSASTESVTETTTTSKDDLMVAYGERSGFDVSDTTIEYETATTSMEVSKETYYDESTAPILTGTLNENDYEESNYTGYSKVSDSNLDYDEPIIEITTRKIEELNPGPVIRIIEDEKLDENTTEYPIPEPPSVFEGGSFWQSKSVTPLVTTEKPAFTPQIIHDTTISQKVTKELETKSLDGNNQPHKTGTYVCIAIIIILLVGLIGFAIVKSQMRKRRDRRLLRQQKRDVEKASKEMVDMNKSLLGKPALVEPSIEKKVNGNYELVPTHETPSKKSDNGEIANGLKPTDTTNGNVRTDSPRDSNQNKSSSKDNNLIDSKSPAQDSSFKSAVPDSNDCRKDANSLSSEDIFIPINENSAPRLNGSDDPSLSQPLMNGDQNTDSDFMSPSKDYIPVYLPDMGRVRIKMTETPKPKTPVLVTRSRSNAGDIIITPTLDENLLKATT